MSMAMSASAVFSAAMAATTMLTAAQAIRISHAARVFSRVSRVRVSLAM
ncbi:Uncharacterised protein [Mycobacteroides abscessus subsp. abscessus]|nr:Uncharacterised protein [Mycobacteroides abscessus subsp. abscessus]